MDDPDLKRLIEQVGAETRQHFDVVAEGLRHDIQFVSEGVNSHSDRLERLAGEMHEEFEEVRSMIRLSFTELDRRLRNLEEIVSNLQSRLERLESTSPQ